MNNHLEEIIIELANENVSFIISGGVAGVLHGLERMTLDLDISVDRKPENLKRFIAVMKKLNMVPRAPVQPEIFLDDELLNKIAKEKNALVFTFIDIDNPYKQVDIFITKSMGYNVLLEDTEEKEMYGVKIRYLTIEKLIELKQKIEPMRSKDKWDIEELKKILAIKKNNGSKE
ncbi:MAG: hypothetical protein WD334_00080 [Chitinophagales bacterium]